MRGLNYKALLRTYQYVMLATKQRPASVQDIMDYLEDEDCRVSDYVIRIYLENIMACDSLIRQGKADGHTVWWNEGV